VGKRILGGWKTPKGVTQISALHSNLELCMGKPLCRPSGAFSQIGLRIPTASAVGYGISSRRDFAQN